jgi:hypothetical protein
MNTQVFAEKIVVIQHLYQSHGFLFHELTHGWSAMRSEGIYGL